MKTLLDEAMQALTDLMQMGLATAGPQMAVRMKELSDRFEATGLHTGSRILAEIARLLSERSHAMEKTDLTLTAAVCRMEHYTALCRSRMTEEEIRRRWQKGGKE